MLRAPAPEAIRDATLVLSAMGIRCEVVRSSDGWLLVVREHDEAAARRELLTYLRENQRAGELEEPFQAQSDGLAAAMLYAALLGLGFLLERSDAFGLAWWDSGLLDAGKVRDGEVWRAVTALTLHSDPAHLAGNIVFGSLFGVLLAQLVGSGWTWLSILVAGSLGGVLNAWAHPLPHRSIGASTAVFAALGLLVGVEIGRRHRARPRGLKRFAPLVLGLVLLGWLGLGGGAPEQGRVDVLAHGMGFLAGLACTPLLLGVLARGASARAQTRAAAAAGGLVAVAWAVALIA